MRILIISFFFPPDNTIGALRVGKTAKFLRKFGHEVKVITAQDQGPKPMLDLEIPAEDVIYTDWDRTDELLNSKHGKATKLYRRMKLARTHGLHFMLPCGMVGWYSYALDAAHNLSLTWKPDVIFASLQPPTSLFIAHKLSQTYSIPWVAEFRDLWAHNHVAINTLPKWQMVITEQLEKYFLSSASGIVTVSEPLAEVLRQDFSQPISVVLNGFDPEDYLPECVPPLYDGMIHIVYTGSLYSNYDLPTLFNAVSRLGPLAEKLRIHFYEHGDNEYLKALIAKYQMECFVKVMGQVPYKQSVKAQMEADVLLLFTWNDPNMRGIYTGKVFEYIGARRPILAVGPSNHDILSNYTYAFISNDPVQIAEQLSYWIRQKRTEVGISSAPSGAGDEYSREVQTAKLEYFLSQVTGIRSRV
jgi:glycosyltransferase involved in cell wall biosynthesis